MQILITPLVSSNSSCTFVLFLLAIVLSVLLRYTDSDYPFGIFKLFPLQCFYFYYVVLKLGDICIVFEDLLTSIVGLMVGN
jgi:hypothetical protein